MPNWPISACASLLASSAVSLSRNALVPERAIVPRPAVRSSRRHADAVIGDGQRLVGIERDGDDERPALGQFGPGDRLVAQLLAGVGGVGDELADKNFPVGIDRMDHQMQQARDVGLEALRLGCFGRRGLGVGGQMGPLCNHGGARAAPGAAAGPDIVALPPGFKVYRARHGGLGAERASPRWNGLRFDLISAVKREAVVSEQLLVTEYEPGAAIGWHRDRRSTARRSASPSRPHALSDLAKKLGQEG